MCDGRCMDVLEREKKMLWAETMLTSGACLEVGKTAANSSSSSPVQEICESRFFVGKDFVRNNNNNRTTTFGNKKSGLNFLFSAKIERESGREKIAQKAFVRRRRRSRNNSAKIFQILAPSF